MHLTLHFTRQCNLRCRYCYATPKASAVMSADTVRAAMELGLAHNGGSCGVVFFGGEPLLHKELICQGVEIGKGLQAAGKGRLHYKITTNGLLLDEPMLELLEREQIGVAMSFDGVREANDCHRVFPDGRGTFDTALPQLQRLLHAKPYTSTITVVNPDTARYMCDSVQYILDLGVRYVILALNYAADWNEDSLAMLEKQYRKLAGLYLKWTRNGRKFYFSPFEVKMASHIHAHRCDSLRCDCGVRQLSVDPEGFLYPCVQFPKAGATSPWCIGDVRRGIDEDAWRRVRQQVTVPKEACSKCAIEQRCLHTCACLNWQAIGRVDQPSGVLCRHEQMLVKVADRLAERLYKRREPLFIQKHYNELYPLLSLVEDQLSGA